MVPVAEAHERGLVREGVESFLEKCDPKFPDRISDGLPDLFE